MHCTVLLRFKQTKIFVDQISKLSNLYSVHALILEKVSNFHLKESFLIMKKLSEAFTFYDNENAL